MKTKTTTKESGMNEKKWIVALWCFVGICFFMEVLILDSDRQRANDRLDIISAQIEGMLKR